MSVVARKIVSTPVRGSSETWAVVTDLLAPKAGDARRELTAVAGVACSLIASETPSRDPIVIWGNGPRVRVYCLFGDDAITADDKNENALATCPTDGNWSMSLPCEEEDLAWVQQELTKHSKRISARKLGDSVPDEDLATRSVSDQAATIDEESFFRP
jgi:hypothetical protein